MNEHSLPVALNQRLMRNVHIKPARQRSSQIIAMSVFYSDFILTLKRRVKNKTTLSPDMIGKNNKVRSLALWIRRKGSKGAFKNTLQWLFPDKKQKHNNMIYKDNKQKLKIKKTQWMYCLVVFPIPFRTFPGKDS